MKVLLDECVPERLRGDLREHEVHSARYAGLSGRKNGELLLLAEEAGYDVLLTVDQGIPHQHNMTGRRIGVIVLRAPGNDIDTLKEMTNAVSRSLTTISAGEIVTLEYSANRSS
jgi:hypothetical protein